MIDNIREFWYLWLVVVALLVVAVFAIKKASAAVRKHNETIRKQDEAIKRLKYLVDNYSDLNGEKAEKSDAKELIEGVAAVVQRRLEKSGDFDGEFKNASELEKKLYACNCFFEDLENGKLSDWCRNNGEPLVSLTFGLFSDIGQTKLLRIMKNMYPMFDRNDDCASFDKKRVDELDSEFSKAYSESEVARTVKEFAVSLLKREKCEKTLDKQE